MPGDASPPRPPRRIPVQSVKGPIPGDETLRLLFCLVEIERQAEIFSQSLDDAISEAIDRGNTMPAWRHIQSAMFAAIIVNRFVRIRKATNSTADRRARLRGLLALPDFQASTLWVDKVANVRNSLEHVDERFDLAFETPGVTSLADWYLWDDFFLTPPEGTPSGAYKAGLRAFHPEAGLLLFDRESLDLFALDIGMVKLRHNSRDAQAELLQTLQGRRMQFGGWRTSRVAFPADRMIRWRSQRAELEAEMAAVPPLDGYVRLWMQAEVSASQSATSEP
jgi:hypothetical protein